MAWDTVGETWSLYTCIAHIKRLNVSACSQSVSLYFNEIFIIDLVINIIILNWSTSKNTEKAGGVNFNHFVKSQF